MNEPDDDKYLDGDKVIAERLEILKQKFDGGRGNKAALLMAVYQCALMGKPLPEWLRQAFIETYESAARYEIRSWDEAFGRPQVQGAHLNPRKEYADLRYEIALRVALRTPEKEPIEPDLFDKIGAELGIGKTKASDIYYNFGGKELHETLEPFAPFLRDRIGKNLSTAQLIEVKQTSGKN
jgi:hypothetical protein